MELPSILTLALFPWPPAILTIVVIACVTGVALAENLEAKDAKSIPLEDLIPLGMQVMVSLILLGACLYLILSGKYSTADQHWAYGTVGTIVGFWLKTGTLSRKRR